MIVGIGALISLYKQRRRESDGYEPIQTENDEDGNPIAKAFTAEDGGRIPIKGAKILLLAIPACCDITGTTSVAFPPFPKLVLYASRSKLTCRTCKIA